MKPIILSVAFCCTMLFSFAQSDRYAGAMKKNLALFDSSKTVADFQSLSDAFIRIGDAEKTQWQPYYYAALALSSAGWAGVQDNNFDKDANAQKMNTLCDKAEALATTDADKSEICAIRNMSATQQMMVDPQSRYMQYGVEAGNQLKKGLQLNPNNPRLYYLQGMSLFNTPPQYGGGKDKAKPVFEKAISLYNAEQPSGFNPRWGKQQAEAQLALCQ
ncbi:MAG TPA: hypothetical protein VG738_18510 [Chitinophagaceae bacterium]|nr:hypothetical protein [Chitinophagaceae bacterium]